MKKITASKTLSIAINGKGKYYLPDDLLLNGKTINAIVPVLGMYSFADNAVGAPITDGNNLFMNITNNGQYYFIQDMPVEQLSSKVVRGKFEKIDEKLNLPSCYVECTDNTVGNLILVVFYEDTANFNAETSVNSNYEFCEIPMLYKNGYRNQLPDKNSLRGKKFRNIICTYPAVTPSGYTSVASTEGNYSYLTLCRGSKIIIDKMPLPLLQQIEQYELLRFANIEFDFENSYIQVFGTPDIDNKYLYLIFEYER